MTPAPRKSSSVWLVIDLTGSNLGPAYRSVVVECEPWGDDFELRLAASGHYDVPIEQVGPVLDRDPEDWTDA